MKKKSLVTSIKALTNASLATNNLVLKSSLNEGNLSYEKRGFSLKTLEASLGNNNFSYEKKI